MRKFKIKIGYGKGEYIIIDENELEMALYCFQTNNKGIFKSGPIRGQDIIIITPHYHAHTGWNEDYEPLNADDWTQIERDCPDYKGIISYYTERVQYMIGNSRTNLIGKKAELPLTLPPALKHEK